MDQCSHIKPNGERCKKPAHGQQDVCWSHSPKHSAERVRTASRGGRGKANPGPRMVRELMDHLTVRVLRGDLEPAILYAVVAAQNTKLKAIETERRLEENDVRQEFQDLKAILQEHGVLAG